MRIDQTRTVGSRLQALRPRGPLGQNRDFVAIWSAATVSQLGTQVSLLALPFVAITTLEASTLEVAMLGIAELVPLLLFGLPAGAWIDRARRRPVMIAADLTCACAFVSIPSAYAAGVLTIWQLYVVGFATGTFAMFFDVASQSFLPAIVPREELPGANATSRSPRKRRRSEAPVSRACSSACSEPRTRSLPTPRATSARPRCCCASSSTRQACRRSTAERCGARSGRGSRTSSATRSCGRLMFTSTANIFNSILFAVLLLFSVRHLHLSARQIGLILMLANVGSLAGALATTRLQRRFGLGRVMLATAFGGWALLLIPFASGAGRIPMIAAGLLLWGTAVVVFNATSATLVQATAPARLMSRVFASRRLVSWGVMPVGTLLGGLLGTYLGLRTAVFVGAGGRALAGLIILFSPVRSIRTLDDAQALVAAYNATAMVPAAE